MTVANEQLILAVTELIKSMVNVTLVVKTQNMYALAVKADKLTDDSEVDNPYWTAGEPEQIAYWRKHPNLHGWMQMLYEQKGGQSPDFNGNSVRLNKLDLDELEAKIQKGTLPHTTGSFFGVSQRDDRELDLQFIIRARNMIKQGYAIFYNSSW